MGNELVYTRAHDATVIRHLTLPSGGIPQNSWEDDRLDLEHGIKTFSVHPEKNLLVVLEGWFDDGRWVTCLGDHTHLIHSSNLWNIGFTGYLVSGCTLSDWIQPGTPYCLTTAN